MRLGTVLFAAYSLIVAVCGAYPLSLVASRLRIAYLESAEEPLVDAANILAAFVGKAAERGPLDSEELYAIFGDAYSRDVSAAIYEMVKERVDLDVYITDARGIVVFDSRGRETLGEDYSQWRDVKRTLEGRYGARVGREAGDPSSTAVLYVAAPIVTRGEVKGVLTVAKPTTAVDAFLRTARPRLFGIAALTLVAIIFFSLLLSLWVTQQVDRLTRYADAVREGRRVPFPKLAKTELLTMGLAFEKMRESLAGQAYIEQYVQALTHELKSPISAISGAAEILESPTLTAERRAQFLRNIHNETRRIQDLVDRLLALSELEVRRALPVSAAVSIAPVLRTILEGQEPTLSKKRIHVHVEVPEELLLAGDGFLLHLALSNLIVNAIEFSPEGGRIRIYSEREPHETRLCIEDEGPGIPEYAKARVFERFFSLQRPDTGKKSTGLGLNLVKEIVALHQGEVRLENLPERGLRASLHLPGARAA